VSLLVAVELYEHGPAVGLVVHEREQEQALYDAAHLGDGLDELRLLRAGVPFVVSRAMDRLHARVLEKLGADRIIEPEKDMGAQLARTMASPTVMD
jgi:Trk K+ transport system NAD-binding subunit